MSLFGTGVVATIVSGETIWLIASRQIAAQQTKVSQQQQQAANMQAQINQLQGQLAEQGARLDLNYHRFTITLDAIGILNNSQQAVSAVKRQIRAIPVFQGREAGLVVVYAGAPTANDIPQAVNIANAIYSILASLGREGFVFAKASYYDPLYLIGGDLTIAHIDVYFFSASLSPTPTSTSLPTDTPTPLSTT